ncbi:MAG TPA: 16S rRNA (guanine(966)-N(2))-methyltransferase RsmD [Candidatus Saccharimonadales bacterium]|nr:16S rRNA (guanine(966)-N(2))-methyltransferase RsmD [Candidatus Saccharimonadales bacterium]
MNVRIISGEFGGRKIEAPDTNRTHPMSERARGAMFNSLGGLVEGASVLDAFAGTGSIGLEALSRGAHDVTFVERDRIAQKVLAKNITSLGVEARTALIRTTVHNWLETKGDEKFDIIFADPPYNDPQFSTAQRLLGLLKPGGYMILSHPGRGEELAKTGVVVVDNRSYGNAFLTYYRRDEAA